MPRYRARRTLLNDPQEAYRTLVEKLPSLNDLSILEVGNPITVDRKRRLSAGRYRMSGEILIQGNQITFALDGNGTDHGKFVEEILSLLPFPSVDDHGIPAAKAKMGRFLRFIGAYELSDLHNDMQPDEVVSLITTGNLGDESLLVVLTDQRLLLKEKGFFETSTKEVNLRSVSSVSTKSGQTDDSLALTVSGASMEIFSLPSGHGKELANLIRQRTASLNSPATLVPEAQSVPLAATELPATGFGMDDLLKLVELHASGILTDEEFAAAKAKALGL